MVWFERHCFSSSLMDSSCISRAFDQTQQIPGVNGVGDRNRRPAWSSGFASSLRLRSTQHSSFIVVRRVSVGARRTASENSARAPKRSNWSAKAMPRFRCASADLVSRVDDLTKNGTASLCRPITGRTIARAVRAVLLSGSIRLRFVAPVRLPRSVIRSLESGRDSRTLVHIEDCFLLPDGTAASRCLALALLAVKHTQIVWASAYCGSREIAALRCFRRPRSGLSADSRKPS